MHACLWHGAGDSYEVSGSVLRYVLNGIYYKVSGKPYFRKSTYAYRWPLYLFWSSMYQQWRIGPTVNGGVYAYAPRTRTRTYGPPPAFGWTVFSMRNWTVEEGFAVEGDAPSPPPPFTHTSTRTHARTRAHKWMCPHCHANLAVVGHAL